VPGRRTLQLIVPGGFSDWVRAAQVMASSLRAAGIRVEVKTYDFNAWYDKLQTGDFDLSISWSERGPTPYNLYRGLMSTHTVKPLGEPAAENWQRFGLAEADVALAALQATGDPERQRVLFNELQALFVDHVPAIPLFPGPAWGQFNTKRFVGFPSAEDPYAPLSPHWAPQSLLVITQVRPR
jgi:peptide/nickel transport system substrate-binding protein